jgi:hypothetical protein
MYSVYTDIFTLQVRMFTSGIHYIGWGQSPDHQEILLDGNFVFDLHDVFRNDTAVNQNLPVSSEILFLRITLFTWV